MAGMLMLDRYLVSGGRALDLATGVGIRWHVRRSGTRPPPPLFATRGPAWLIDFDRRGHSRIEVWERLADGLPAEPDHAATLDAFRAALADARDGRPRALDLVEPSTASWARTHRLLAREARLAGFVPLAADALGAVLAQARWRWPSWLKDRSIVVFATDAQLSPDAALALFRLATKDARPHLVVRTATGDAAWRPRFVPTVFQVHESGADGGLGGPGGLIARARDLHASGRLIDAEAAARWGVLLTGPGPDHAAARCALARCLIAQRRLLEARAALLTVNDAEADNLRSQILAGPAEPAAEPAMVDTFLEILRACQEVDDGALTLTRVSAMVRERLAASTVAVVSRHGSESLAVAHAGGGVPRRAQIEVAAQVLDTGEPVGPVDRGHAVEAAWPVRYGAQIVGALWCHWAIGAAVASVDIATMLRLAATAAAPAVFEVSERLRAPVPTTGLMPELVGESDAMQQVRLAIVRAAGSPFPVLIEGESGVGKELVARAVHAASARRGHRFCALNCAALSDELVEAELFGHARGAFTGAIAERVGLFEDAQGGTLFLDEVAELSARVQAKLLRTLQEGEVRRVGESQMRKVDARIVAATNRPLAGEVAGDRFRADLRYRLDVLRIVIPPLRERLDDLPPLVRHLWSVLGARTGCRAVLSPAAITALGAYDWPGNVRELQNVLASVMVAGPARGVIGATGLPAHMTRATAVAGRTTLADARRLFETHYVRAALARSGGRPLAAARDLGVSRQGLTKLMARLDLPAVERPATANALE
jgi:DNA-binding NtrC family response regulator